MIPEIAGSTPALRSKLFAVVRADLAPGVQLVQVAHALRHYQAGYPAQEARWWSCSTHLVVLQVPDLAALEALLGQLGGLNVAAFREPWLEDQLTAVAVEHDAWRLLSNLPLALRT